MRVVSLLVVVAVLLLVVTLMFRRQGDGSDELLVYCAASMKVPLEELAGVYQADYGKLIRLQYGGSNTLLSQAELSRTGDLFLAADESYLDIGRRRGVVGEIVPVLAMHAVLGVARGNPKRIVMLDDLLRSDVRVALADPELAAIGKVTREQLQHSGDWEALEQSIEQRGVYKPTVSDVANDVKLGSVDAGVLWDAVARQYPEIEIVRVAELEDGVANVSVGVLTSSRDPEQARSFAKFLARDPRSTDLFAKLGYTPLESAPPRQVELGVSDAP